MNQLLLASLVLGISASASASTYEQIAVCVDGTTEYWVYDTSSDPENGQTPVGVLKSAPGDEIVSINGFLSSTAELTLPGYLPGKTRLSGTSCRFVPKPTQYGATEMMRGRSYFVHDSVGFADTTPLAELVAKSLLIPFHYRFDCLHRVDGIPGCAKIEILPEPVEVDPGH